MHADTQEANVEITMHLPAIALGNYADNLAALELALAARQEGALSEATHCLLDLHEHIRSTGEVKSVIWLLPTIERLLLQMQGPPPLATNVGELRSVAA